MAGINDFCGLPDDQSYQQGFPDDISGGSGSGVFGSGT